MVSTYPTLQIQKLISCREQILLQEMAWKRRSWVHHKRQKTVAFSGFDKIQRPNSTTEVLHAQFQQHDFSQIFKLTIQILDG